LTIGKNIVKLRQEKNLTQKELAEGAGISLSYHKKIESGHISAHVATLARIANYLGVQLVELFENN
jgi:XRE family transcriptional regulator, regulator of sulfur utilization